MIVFLQFKEMELTTGWNYKNESLEEAGRCLFCTFKQKRDVYYIKKSFTIEKQPTL